MQRSVDPNYQKFIQECANGTCKSIQKLLTAKPYLCKELINRVDGKDTLDYGRANQNNKNGEIISFLYKNITQGQKNFVLRRAANNGNVPLCQESLAHGATTEHDCNITPFDLATLSGNINVVQFFHDQQPQVKKFYNFGLAVVSQRGYIELVKWFIRNGTNTGHVDPDTSQTPAQLAMQQGHISSVALLL